MSENSFVFGPFVYEWLWLEAEAEHRYPHLVEGLHVILSEVRRKRQMPDLG